MATDGLIGMNSNILEHRTYGSVRGAPGDSHPYHDSLDALIGTHKMVEIMKVFLP
jgi:hypothetical protein